MYLSTEGIEAALSTTPAIVIEGTLDEIIDRLREHSGRRFRVTILQEAPTVCVVKPNIRAAVPAPRTGPTTLSKQSRLHYEIYD